MVAVWLPVTPILLVFVRHWVLRLHAATCSTLVWCFWWVIASFELLRQRVYWKWTAKIKLEAHVISNVHQMFKVLRVKLLYIWWWNLLQKNSCLCFSEDRWSCGNARFRKGIAVLSYKTVICFLINKLRDFQIGVVSRCCSLVGQVVPCHLLFSLL